MSEMYYIPTVFILLIYFQLISKLYLPMQSVPTATNVMHLNPPQARYARYNIMW